MYDVDSAKAAAMAKQHHTVSFASMANMGEAGTDVIHVLTPPHVHAAVALSAGNGLPCTGGKAAGCRGGRLQQNPAQGPTRKGCRFALTIHFCLTRKSAGAAVVKSGKLGTVRSVDFLRSSQYPPYEGGVLPPQFRTAGYPFRDLGVHSLYLFEAFLGPIENVDASWASLGGEPNLAFDEWRARVRAAMDWGNFSCRGTAGRCKAN